MFKATEGYVMVGADYSQQEPRTLAFVSQDKDLINAYKQGRDIYAFIAMAVYKVDYEDCLEFYPDGKVNPEGKKRRSSCKSVLLGLMYGRGIGAIAEQLGCTTKEAQDIKDRFFKSFPNVEKWMSKTISDAKRNGYVETICGRRRRLPDIQLPNYEVTRLDGTEVDSQTERRYLALLRDARGLKQKNSIIYNARQVGIKIKDNTGFIAEAERQAINSVIQGR